MAYRDALLVALTYPDATPDRAIRSGVALACKLGGEFTLLTVRIDIPAVGNWFANRLFHFDDVAAEEEGRSAVAAQLETIWAGIAAEESGVVIHTQSAVARLFEEAEVIASLARTRDVALIGIGPQTPAGRRLAEPLFFGTGRPVLVYPEDEEVIAADRFDDIVIAWDGQAAAARAVADAMPLLQKANTVRILVVLGDKPAGDKGNAEELARHLLTHGVAATVEARSGTGGVGSRLRDYVVEQRPDLLVMGGFGHARLREFMLGGLTQAVLDSPPCPVLLSH